MFGLRKDGGLFPLSLAVADASVEGQRLFTGIVRDITDRKEAEQALAHQLSFNMALVDTIPSPMFVKDKEVVVASSYDKAAQINNNN